MKQMILYEDIPVEEGRLPREMAVYRLLGALGIPFKRMDHKPVATIELWREGPCCGRQGPAQA